MSKQYGRGEAPASVRTRWKKGQCGNRKREYRLRQPKSAIEILHQCFAETVKITENGKPRRTSVFEAIYLQLLLKDAAGSKRAMKVRMKYELMAIEHAGHEPEFILKHIPHMAKSEPTEPEINEEKDEQ